MVFYIYIISLKLIPNIFPPATLTIFILVSIGYSCLLHNIIFEFSSFDLWDQNKIILISFISAISSYIYKDKIKLIITSEFIKYSFEVASAVSIHLRLYDKNMSDWTVFLYTFSCAYIFWETIFQYKFANYLKKKLTIDASQTFDMLMICE